MEPHKIWSYDEANENRNHEHPEEFPLLATVHELTKILYLNACQVTGGEISG